MHFSGHYLTGKNNRDTSLTVALEPVQALANNAIPAILSAVETRSNGYAGFRPGVSGNPSGRPKSAKLRRALLRQLNQQIADGITRSDVAADALVLAAEAGGRVGVSAFEAIRDTVDGKPTSNEQHTTVGTINIAWGAMPQWAQRDTVAQSDNVLNSNQCLPSDTVPEVQSKVLESAPRRLAQERPAKLRDRVPVSAVPAAAVPVQAASRPMSITRMVAERALAKLAEMDTVGMSPATFKNYLAKVRVAEEALAAL